MRILFFLPMINALKLCAQCKHFRLTENPNLGKCSLFKQINDYTLVTGKVEIDYKYCYEVRLTNRMCGEKGKLYEPKDTRLK
jgi:hypothetical protein